MDTLFAPEVFPLNAVLPTATFSEPSVFAVNASNLQMISYVCVLIMMVDLITKLQRPMSQCGLKYSP